MLFPRSKPGGQESYSLYAVLFVVRKEIPVIVAMK